MNNTQFIFTNRLNTIWMAAVITLIIGMISTTIHQRAVIRRVEAIRTDIQLIDAATTQLSLAGNSPR